MATQLLKPVKRELRSTDRKGRTLIVTIEPGDILTFKPKGLRRSVSIYIGHAYALAQIMTAEEDYKKAMQTYTLRKKAGAQFLRKPKRSALPFNPVYFKALKGI